MAQNSVIQFRPFNSLCIITKYARQGKRCWKCVFSHSLFTRNSTQFPIPFHFSLPQDTMVRKTVLLLNVQKKKKSTTGKTGSLLDEEKRKH
jgi:hypothetical protein